MCRARAVRKGRLCVCKVSDLLAAHPTERKATLMH
jgi:hypothetical protein